MVDLLVIFIFPNRDATLATAVAQADVVVAIQRGGAVRFFQVHVERCKTRQELKTLGAAPWRATGMSFEIVFFMLLQWIGPLIR